MTEDALFERQANPGIQRRQTAILDLLRQRGFVAIDQMAKAFKVSEQTVRRDIIQLERRGLVARYHGGAGLPVGRTVMDYDSRKSRFSQEKQIIGGLVASEVPEGATVFIDIGTTMEAVAEALLGHHQLTILTNHIAIANLLSQKSEFQIILAGGLLRQRDHATTGEATREFLERFRVGYGIFGIGGVEPDGGLLDYDYRDIGVSKTAMQISRRKFVALDHSKFGSDATVRVAHACEVDAVFTDMPPPEPYLSALVDQGVRLVHPGPR
ncbi:MAG: DeoR/GlpR family DNA-binding transcription regulator [Methyloligellaceae bacterium]